MMTTTQPPIQILMVDDDDDDYITTRCLLSDIPSERLRFHLDRVASFEDALNKLEETSHDLYLLDYQLGKTNGLDLLTIIVEEKPQAAAIMLTGINNAQVDMEALRRGASEYVVKGNFNSDVLERAIRYSLRHKKMMNQLQETDQQKELFVAALTHDLRSPIQGELMVLEQLVTEEHGALNALQKKIMGEIIKSNRFIYQMINNLLTTYKYRNHVVELNPEPANLNALIQDVLDGHIRILASEKQINLECSLDESIPNLSLDTIEIQRVLYNLLQNAIHHSPKGQPIRITSTRQNEGVSVSVQDQGEGVPDHVQALIFDPYISLAKKFRKIGTGLGLYLCKRIVLAHGGDITYKNQPEGGCVFSFQLPQVPSVILP